MASLSPSSSALELSIRALEVLRNFLHTEGASIIDVERHLVAFYPEWSFDSELTELFASIIECEPDDLDKFSQINAAIDAKVESLTFELYTRASPGPLTENAIEEPRSLHILPTLDVQSSSDAVNPSLLAVHPSSSKTLASSDQSTPVSSPSKNRLTLKEYAQRKKDRTVSQMVATAATPSSSVVPADDLSGDINVDLAFVGLFPILDAATSNSPPPSSAQADTSAIVVTPIVGPNTQTISSAISSAEGISESHANDIRSMDGRFGAILINKDIVVTTPNANVIYAPITPHCQTRMRRSFNFAKDDPLYWPQPFHVEVGHLAVVPCPSHEFDHPLRYAWYPLQNDDYVQIHREGVDGLVTLAAWVATEMKKLCAELLDNIRGLDDESRADLFLSRGRDQIRKYMERLYMTGSRFRVSLVFSCLQRVFLETYARWQWLTKWSPRLLDVDSSFSVDDNVIGAFTGDLSVAADLFRIGCPLWLVRPCAELVNIRIDRHVDPLDETEDHTLPIRNSNERVDVSDADPPHQLIYSGLPGRFTRYARISQFLQQYFSNPVIESFAGHDPNVQYSLVASSILPSGSSSHIAQPSASSAPSAPPASSRYLKDLELIDLSSRNNITLHVLPPPKKKKKKAATSGELNNQVRRNRFLSIPSPVMPVRLALWSEANKSLSDFHLRSGASLLEQAYPLPDVFFTPSNDLKVSLLLVWLRLRPIFQWKLSLPNRLKGYKNMEWRALFEAIDGKKIESMKARANMLKELEDLCRQSSLAFQLDKLPLPYWSGDIVEVDSNGELDSRVVTEILWELLEVNFRMELITLDRAVVPEPQGDSDAFVLMRDNWLDRERVINSCWVGHARQPLITSPGLSSNRPYEYRLVFLKALATVLKSWPGVKPPELEKPFPVANSIIFEIELRKLEEAMAYYYTRKFLLTFHRAATIPHISPYVTLYTHLN